MTEGTPAMPDTIFDLRAWTPDKVTLERLHAKAAATNDQLIEVLGTIAMGQLLTDQFGLPIGRTIYLYGLPVVRTFDTLTPLDLEIVDIAKDTYLQIAHTVSVETQPLLLLTVLEEFETGCWEPGPSFAYLSGHRCFTCKGTFDKVDDDAMVVHDMRFALCGSCARKAERTANGQVDDEMERDAERRSAPFHEKARA